MYRFITKEQLSSDLSSLFLTETQFWKRFIRISRVQDTFVRVYDVCEDTFNNNERIAIKDYCSSTQEQCQDVLMNLLGYRSIEQIQQICKLIAFCQQKQTGDIKAAFEYQGQSLLELYQKRYYGQNRYEFYLFLLKEILFAIQNFKNVGVILEEIMLTNILVYKCDNFFRIKILFDQREKRYDKIQQGIKVFCSAQSVNKGIKQIRQQQNNSCEEVIYQLGLLLLDIVFQYQLVSSKSQNMSNDTLNTQNILFRSYLTFENHEHCCQNRDLINVKLKYLSEISNAFIRQLVTLIKKMTQIEQKKIKMQDLMVQALNLNIQKTYIYPVIKQQASWQQKYKKQVIPAKSSQYVYRTEDSLKYSQSHTSMNNVKKYIGSQTTVGTNNLISTENLVVSRPKQNKLDFFVIPKEKILSVHCHKDLKSKLQMFLIQLQNKVHLTKKDYYDSNVYYGQIDPTSQKRHGSGIYVYSSGDIYFGSWNQNLLISGIYIFKNGEGFEGVVKNGKQGKGKYYYSNSNVYQGQWLDDMKHGYGKMYYSNGQSYDGNWSRGKKYGQGTYFYIDGTIFRGNFNFGKKQGFGTIDFPNGTRIEANWKANQLFGVGKIYYKNGDYFQGIFNYSEKHGKGCYKWDDFTFYEGQFRKDLMQGEARIKFGQNEYYEGHIKNGKREGQGLYRYANGDEYRGEWKNDEKYSGQYKYINGNVFQGKFKKGEMFYGVMSYQNGQIYEGQFINGLRNGKGVYYDRQNVKKLEGRWENDRFINN